MRQYLPMGKGKLGFPEMKDVIDIAGWFARADPFILKNRIPVDDKTRLQLKATWNRVGEARLVLLAVTVIGVPFGLEQIGEATDLFKFPVTKTIRGWVANSTPSVSGGSAAKSVNWERYRKDLEEFTRVDGESLVRGSRKYVARDAFTLASGGWLMIDSFLPPDGTVFKIIDENYREVASLLCVIIGEKGGK